MEPVIHTSFCEAEVPVARWALWFANPRMEYGLPQVRGALLMGLFLTHFQAAKAEWSQTLWVNLNVQFLQEGIDGFLKSLRKLPRQVRNLTVAYHLEAKMKAFKDSIPLLLDLKHEALRDRLVSSC